MSYLYKIMSTKSPPYLYELIPPFQRSHCYPGCFKTLVFTVFCNIMNAMNWILILRTVILTQFSAKNFWLL